jgi:hypothetical protein
MIDFVEKYFPTGFRQGKKKDKTTTRIKFESLAVGITLALREQEDLEPASVYFLDSKEFREFTSGDASSSKNNYSQFILNQCDDLLIFFFMALQSIPKINFLLKIKPKSCAIS